ncbi:hypothetical protein C7H84_01460 [Burkholderia sp. Nafp2/4-1b]|nr:hypothetical protein C7H84_01460 [Burkholderia sp. Nafp2/4-1b]
MHAVAARSQTMKFGLLLSNLPHVTESHPHYDAMLMLDARPRVFSRLFSRSLNRLKSLLHFH